MPSKTPADGARQDVASDRSRLEHGEWLMSVGRIDDAAPLLVEAGEIFGHLGATLWLRRLSRLDKAPSAPAAAAEPATPSAIEGAR
jgi:hypothetical protein